MISLHDDMFHSFPCRGRDIHCKVIIYGGDDGTDKFPGIADSKTVSE